MAGSTMVNWVLRARPWVLFLVMVVTPLCTASALVCGPRLVSAQLVLPLFVVTMVTAVVPLLTWSWIVASELAAVIGGQAQLGARLFRGAFVSGVVAIAFVFVAGFLWPGVPEGLLTIGSAVGTLGYLYGVCFLAWVAPRADLGARMRIWHVMLTLVLWGFPQLGACLIQRRVNRVFARVSQPG